jgi:hypothetical protein
METATVLGTGDLGTWGWGDCDFVMGGGVECVEFLGGLSLFDPRWFGVSPTLGAFLDVQDQGIPMDVDSALAQIVGLTHGFPAVFWG